MYQQMYQWMYQETDRFPVASSVPSMDVPRGEKVPHLPI